jgi:hypothetical protein
VRRIALRIAATVCIAAFSSGCLTGFYGGGDRNYDIDWGKIGTGEQVIAPVNEGQPWQGDAAEMASGQ